jgi:2-methylcitrate dehydratase PrpD
MVAVPLLRGSLTAEDYEDKAAADPRIDDLRAKMEVVENTDFSCDYLDPSRRSIANAVQVFFRDGTATERAVVDYPIGHRRRRKEGLPLLLAKFEKNLRGVLPTRKADAILALCDRPGQLEQTTADQFLGLCTI